MFHISSDKRAERSALLICDGLSECLETKAFHDVTIADISRASTVSRSTFYRLFDNLTDVLDYQCSRLFQETLGTFSGVGTPQNAREFVLTFMGTCLKHPAWIAAIASSGRIDLLYKAHLDHAAIIQKTLFKDRVISKSQMNHLLGLLTSSIFSVFVIQQDNSGTAVPEQLYQYCKDNIALLNELL